MALVLAGVVIGIVAAIFCTRELAGMLFAVKATDPMTFAAITFVLALVGLAACCIPVRRATRIDPKKALRMD
jgi:ABC-type antimicrobial peptide transport system permease subunit